MGGHGYSAYNGVSSLLADWGVMTTGGGMLFLSWWFGANAYPTGDNIVMAQQTARMLVKVLQSVHRGRSVAGSMAYLAKLANIRSFSLRGADKVGTTSSPLLCWNNCCRWT